MGALKWVRAGVVLVVAAAVLATVGGAPAQATYPGADGKIAFVRANQIYTMTSQGTSITKITSAGKNYRPKWSPDGRLISYVHESAGGRHDVWVMRPGGGGKRAVTTSGDVTSAGATWSPDGTRLAYAADDVLRITALARGSVPTTPSGYESDSYCAPDPVPSVLVDRFVAWAPDGDRIAVFNRADCYFDHAMWWFHPSTGEVQQVDATGADCCGYSEWTDLFFGPSGDFGYSARDGGDYGETYGPRLIVYPGFASRAGDGGGAPSPSGSFFALTNNRTGTAYVVRAAVDGTHRHRLTEGYQPDWQPLPQ